MTAIPEIPPGFKRFRETGTFGDHIGPMYYCRLPDGQFDYGFRVGPQHLNPSGIVHGGMLFSFADQFLGYIVAAESRRRSATIKLNVEYLAPARLGDWIEGRAETLRLTREIAFMRGTVRSGGHTLMTAQGMWRLLDRY